MTLNAKHTIVNSMGITINTTLITVIYSASALTTAMCDPSGGAPSIEKTCRANYILIITINLDNYSNWLYMAIVIYAYLAICLKN